MKTEDLRKYDAAAGRSVSEGVVVFCTTVKQRGRVLTVLPDGSATLAIENGTTCGPYKPHEFFPVENH